jgi:hypothetical protein
LWDSISKLRKVWEAFGGFDLERFIRLLPVIGRINRINIKCESQGFNRFS